MNIGTLEDVKRNPSTSLIGEKTGEKMKTELNYQEIVAGYYDNLNNNLRNFKGGPGFLETWVHDEDHNRSLLEILDLAHTNGIDLLEIELPQDVVSAINLDWLRRNSSEFGSLELKGQKMIFSKAKANYALDEFAGLSESYADALKRQSQKIQFEGEVKGQSAFSTSSNGGSLAVAVDDKGIVTEARHKGFTGAQQAVVDAFCGILQGRSLHEGAEHGTIRLESMLRNPAKPPKIKGLLTPETADPSFEMPTKMVRALFADYLKKTGQPLKRNFWRDPVPESWLKLSMEEKLKQAQKLLTEVSREFQLQEDVQVTDIKNETRLVLAYVQQKDKPDFGRHMIKIEHRLREILRFEVELQLESLEDRNRRVERTKRVN